MTLAEVIRAIESHNRRYKAEAREKAAFDYLLAETIGRSISRIYSSSAKMPKLYEIYPSLYDSEEIIEQERKRKEELTILRFRQFAAAHNKKYKGAKNNNE